MYICMCIYIFPGLMIRYAMATFDISALASDVNGTTKPAERNVGLISPDWSVNEVE